MELGVCSGIWIGIGFSERHYKELESLLLDSCVSSEVEYSCDCIDMLWLP